MGVADGQTGPDRRRGRRPKPVVGGDSLSDLARDLTTLLDTHRMTRTELAGRVHYRNTTVSEAFSGTRLPSERLLTAIVTELGERPGPWLQRRAAVLQGVNGSGPASGSDMRQPALPGRDAEIERLKALMTAAVGGRSSVLVLRGEAGIGKTAMLQAAAEEAARVGVASLSARCVESEAELAFSTLTALLLPMAQLLPDLPGPRRRALEVALALSDPTPGEAVPGTVAIGLGVLDVFGRVAPAVLALDDVHWMDEASALALSFALRRLSREGVAVLATIRRKTPTPMDLTGYAAMDLKRLGRAAAAQLAARFHGRPLIDAEVDWLMRHAAGNPLALIELSRSDRIPTAAEQDEPPPVPEVLAASFLRRLAPLPAATRQALLLCAADYTTDISRLNEALAPDGAADLEPAEAAELVVVTGGRVEFGHPLLRAVVYHAATPAERREAHARLARVPADGDVSAADHRAWHLAEAALGTDEEVSRILAAAGERAHARGALGAASSAYRRAASTTAAPDTRAQHLVSAATCAYLGSRPDTALALLDELQGDADAARRRQAEHIRGQIRQLRAVPGDLFNELTLAATACRHDWPKAAADMYTTAASVAIMGGLIPEAASAASEGYALAESGAQPGSPAPMVLWMAALVLSGRQAQARDLFRRNGHRLLECDPVDSGMEVFGFAPMALMWLDEHASALRFAESAMRRFQETGATERLAVVSAVSAELDFRRGRWNAAYASAARALSLADAQGQVAPYGYAASTLARIEAAQGVAGRCRAYAQPAASRLRDHGYTGTGMYLELPLAELALGHEDDRAAASRFLSLNAEMRGIGLRSPAMLLHHGDLVEACVRAGRRNDALEVFEELAEDAGSTPPDSVLAQVRRSCGLLADDPATACEHFAAAAELYARCGDPFGVARTRLAWARALARVEPESASTREQLEEARILFRGLQAQPWLRRTERALGVAPSKSANSGYAKLTASEVQVARLFAEGLGTAETADALFLSTRTVEAHLATACSRLQVRSPGELQNLLRDIGVG